MKKAVVITALLILALPAAFITTILLHPFWRRFEEITGIESYGHSGPADWCYLLDYSVITALALFLVCRIGTRDGKAEEGTGP